MVMPNRWATRRTHTTFVYRDKLVGAAQLRGVGREPRGAVYVQ